ncbi:MAG: hypothetical protein WDW36_000485 [Sanguina aurantia]
MADHGTGMLLRALSGVCAHAPARMPPSLRQGMVPLFGVRPPPAVQAPVQARSTLVCTPARCSWLGVPSPQGPRMLLASNC